MKQFCNGNCEECQLQNNCPAPILNWCPEITHGIVWEMNIKGKIGVKNVNM